MLSDIKANANAPICLFDSGIGGLTVLKKVINKFPNENYIYLADLARVPFGDRTKEEIRFIVNEIIEWLAKLNPKVIVMACNTSSATFSSEFSVLSAKFKTPIYGIIENCAKEISHSTYKKVSVWATQLTSQSNCYKNSIQKNNPSLVVEEIACSKLVPMIEDLSFTIDDRNKIIQEYLAQTSEDSEAIILGCTHYPLISEDIMKLSGLKTIDPTDSLLSELERTLTTNKNNGIISSQVLLYATAQNNKIERFVRLYLGADYKVEQISLSKVKTF